jgi:hypothetical protein
MFVQNLLFSFQDFYIESPNTDADVKMKQKTK